MTTLQWTHRWSRTAVLDGLRVFYLDVARGALALLRHGLALLGLAVAAALVLALVQPGWRESAQRLAAEWIPGLRAADPAQDDLRAWSGMEALEASTSGAQAADPGWSGRSGPTAAAGASDEAGTEIRPLDRATAADPSRLTKPQAAIATWLSRRYRVAPEPVSRIVEEAWQVGRRANLDPTLILAIMAVESSFNPFAQSKVGAQGLMQVMTQLHDKKYQPFGGAHAAFDPVTNMRVGVQVLKDFVRLTGDIPTALQYYSGAARLPNDQGYASKVLSEQDHLKNVAAGRNVAVMAPVNSTPRAVRPPPGLEPVKANLPSDALPPSEAQVTEPTGVGRGAVDAAPGQAPAESAAATRHDTHTAAMAAAEPATPAPAPAAASAPAGESGEERRPQI